MGTSIAEALEPHLPGIILGILSAVGLALRWAWTYRTKYAELKLRMDEADADKTDRENKIEARWKELIQKTYEEQSDKLAQQGRMIEALIKRADAAETENTKKDIIIERYGIQQSENMRKIAELNAQIAVLEEVSKERDQVKAQADALKLQVEDLERKVSELEKKADTRHAEMAQITATNQQQYIEIQRLTAEREIGRAHV